MPGSDTLFIVSASPNKCNDYFAVNLALAGACCDCDLAINLGRSCVFAGGAQVDEVIANSLILG